MAAALSTFAPFTALHAFTVVMLVSATVIAILIGRRLRGTPWLVPFETTFAAIAVLMWVVEDTQHILARPLNLAHALPLEVCDLMGLILPLTLFFQLPVLRSLVYFWGIGLSSQGLFTPQIHDGPSTFHYWQFFFRHGAIVGGAIYLVNVHGYRPSWRDWRTAVLLGIAYVLLLLAIDITFGFNYGYVGNARPDQPSLIDVLGPWPWRVGIMIAAATAVFALLMTPWAFRTDARRRNRDSARSSSPRLP
jgi:hypothetical integral membrane protein (TIGR02206 family)